MNIVDAFSFLHKKKYLVFRAANSLQRPLIVSTGIIIAAVPKCACRNNFYRIGVQDDFCRKMWFRATVNSHVFWGLKEREKNHVHFRSRLSRRLHNRSLIYMVT